MPYLSDPEFAPPRELPFPVGTSPFRQKGNAYLADRKYLDDVLSGGYAAAVAALPDASLRAFFAQRFRPSEWYDAYPGSQLEGAAARLAGLSFESHRRRTGSWHAAANATGIYGALLRMISNENVALWGPRISAIYFEFGSMETRSVGPKEVLGTRRGIPEELAQWTMYASVGFCTKALELSGAPRPRADVRDVRADGVAHGRKLVAVDLAMSWL